MSWSNPESPLAPCMESVLSFSSFRARPDFSHQACINIDLGNRQIRHRFSARAMMMELDLHKCCYIILMFQVLANDKSLGGSWRQGSSCTSDRPARVQGQGYDAYLPPPRRHTSIRVIALACFTPHLLRYVLLTPDANTTVESPRRRMSPPPSSSTILTLPMPGTPAWRARVASILSSADTQVLLAFWLFGEQPSSSEPMNSSCDSYA